jgi:hypothetical protein
LNFTAALDRRRRGRALRDLLQGGESTAVNIAAGRGWSVRALVDIARKAHRPRHSGAGRPAGRATRRRS